MKLVFRQIAGEDLEMILNWRTRVDVSAYMYTDVEPSMEKQREWFRRISQDHTRMDWLINVDGEDVGLMSLTRIDRVNKRCDWAYYLGSPNVRGKGIGKSVELNVLQYVFETLNFKKLCCEVFLSNAKVIGIHKKYGSVVEGTRRQHIYKNGEFHDIVEMGILREDWTENIRGIVEYEQAHFEPVSKEVVSGQVDV